MALRSPPILSLTCVALAGVVTGCGGLLPDPAEPKTHAETQHVGNALDEIEPADADEPIEIVCTTGMIADIVQNVGGQHVSSVHAGAKEFPGKGDRLVVRQLFGPGVDPHTHRPAASDVETLAGADLVVFSGLHLEGTLTDVLDRRSRRRPTYAVTRDLPVDQLLVDAEQHDPHVWMDVSLWSRSAERVADLLSRIDPPRADDYAANSKSYLKTLAETDAYAREQLATIPAKQSAKQIPRNI